MDLQSPTRQCSRILVADDQTDILESLQLLLKNEGFDMHAVTSPAAVVEAVQSGQYDALLLDMNYARDTTSGSEGLELLSRIHQIDSAPPVVLMTAWGSVDLAVEAMRGGSCDFVQKPWDNLNLVATLRRSVEEGRRRQQKRTQEKASEAFLIELEEARKIQEALLPAAVPRIPGIEIETSWVPAGNIGGDYFDTIRLDETTLALCIADVSGKGLPAAILMSNMQAAVRVHAKAATTPSEMCARLNRLVGENSEVGRFVTFFYGVLDTARRTLVYSNAGHVPPILVRAGGGQETLSEGGALLGPFPESRYAQATVSLDAGDHLILWTDGITEADNAAGEQFGENGRLAGLLSRNRGMRACGLKQSILDAVSSFAGAPLQDDATLMVVSVCSETPSTP